MNDKTLIVSLCVLLASCAEMQVKRDLTHAQDAQQYRSATASGEALDPTHDCRKFAAPKTWSTFEFSRNARSYRLPNQVIAAAACMSIPAGAKAIEVDGVGKTGISYHDSTSIHPSILFLADDYRPLVDLRQPRLSVREGMKGIVVGAIVPLVDKTANARYVVIYVDPSSTSEAITVYARSTIPVPYGPYGTTRARFFD